MNSTVLKKNNRFWCFVLLCVLKPESAEFYLVHVTSKDFYKKSKNAVLIIYLMLGDLTCDTYFSGWKKVLDL